MGIYDRPLYNICSYQSRGRLVQRTGSREGSLCSFFDVCKAFDRVPHLPLLDQLKEINLDPYLLRWTSNYLSNRSQFVTVEGETSGKLSVVSGVPQGSVLGPLLFVTYINNVTNVISHDSRINMFADDIAYYRIIKSPSDYAVIQEDVDCVSSFMSSKLLEFSANKCRVMLISRKRSKSTPPPPIYLNGTVLSQVTSYKYLGVTITHNLSWKPHILSICNKTRNLIGMIYRKFYRHSKLSTLLRLYLTILRPNLEYACVVWDPSHKVEIDELENVQKFGLRMCSKSWNESYEDLLQQLKLPSLKKRRTHMKLCHLFKIIKQLTFFPDAPIVARTLPYQSRSTHSNAIVVPQAKTSSHQHSFFPHSLNLWNRLSEDITKANNSIAFKQQLLKTNNLH